MKTNIPTADGLEIVYSGRVRIQKNIRTIDVPELTGLPKGEYLNLLICERGSGVYGDPRRAFDHGNKEVVKPGEGILAHSKVWLKDLPEKNYHLLGVTFRIRNSTVLQEWVNPVLNKIRDQDDSDKFALPILKRKWVNRLIPFVENLSWEYRHDQYGRAATLNSYYELLKTELHRCTMVEDATIKIMRTGPAIIRNTLSYFAENIEFKIPLSVVARKVGISPKRLVAAFRDAGQNSPMASLREMRLKNARTLLCDGRWSVKEIAQKVGFSSATVFGRAYKQMYGESPKSDSVVQKAKLQ